MRKDSDDPDALEYTSGNVFADLGLADADVLLVKADLAHAISEEIRARHISQKQAAELLGLTQPQISNLGRMKLDDFSQERLLTTLRRLGIDVEITLHHRDRDGVGTLTVCNAA